MGIFKGRQQVPFNYSAWGYTRYNGTVWHGGIDVVGLDSTTILMPTYNGKSIQGTVVNSTIVPRGSTDRTWEWGNFVCVQLDANQTPDPVNYLYFCHNEKNLVNVGAKVKSGDAIAIMGNTGNAADANPPIKHCHFEVRSAKNKAGLDPTAYTMTENKEGVYGAAEQTEPAVQCAAPLSKEAVLMQLGPASSGDRAALRALAESLCLGYEEDETGRVRIGPASAGDQSTVLTKAAALGLEYGIYEPEAASGAQPGAADEVETARLAQLLARREAELEELRRQCGDAQAAAEKAAQALAAAEARAESSLEKMSATEAKAESYLQKINAAKAALEG